MYLYKDVHAFPLTFVYLHSSFLTLFPEMVISLHVLRSLSSILELYLPMIDDLSVMSSRLTRDRFVVMMIGFMRLTRSDMMASTCVSTNDDRPSLPMYSSPGLYAHIPLRVALNQLLSLSYSKK